MITEVELSGPKQRLQNDKIARTEEKPVNLIKEIIERFKDKQDIVMDWFLETGTVTSLDFGRKFYDCDIDQEIIDIAAMRILEQVKHLFKTI